MGVESLNDAKISELLVCQKRVTNPTSREKTKGKHIETNYNLVDVATGELSFCLYLRQNTIIADDFSCGLRWNMPSGEVVTLARYNGSSHMHKNHLENEELDFEHHVHKATQKYILAGKKPEGYAEKSSKYSTLKGALHCLITDCSITGIASEADHPDLFLSK